MSLRLLATSSKEPWLPAAVCSLFGPATSTAASRASATASLAARRRAALTFLRRCQRRVRPRQPRWYPQVRFNGRKTRVHRVVVEILLGRPLRRQEHVHHLNGDIADNHPRNLQVLSARAHAVVSNAKHAVVGYCLGCGRAFYRKKRGPRRGFCCCRKCWVDVAKRHHGWQRLPTRPAWAQPRLTPVRHQQALAPAGCVGR
jgi:hypothetical protein